MLGGEERDRGRLGVEGRGQQSGLEHEADETRVPEQRFVAGEYAMGQRGTANSGFRHAEDHREDHQQPDSRRQHEERAPTKDGGQLAADWRRHHRPEHVGGGEIGDHLGNAVLAVDVAGDGARQHDAASRACSL